MTAPEKYCSSHSGVCTNVSFLTKSIEDLEKEFSQYKGYITGKMEKQEEKFEKAINEAITRLEKKIDEKDTNSKNNKTLVISTIISPLIVGVVLLFAQYFIK